MKRFSMLLGLAVIVANGCALDTAVDCRSLCERYAECFDTSTDLNACASRCESRVEADENDRADMCDSCLDDNATCATAVVACASSCGPLLAP